jgi:hypothetical protein
MTASNSKPRRAGTGRDEGSIGLIASRSSLTARAALLRQAIPILDLPLPTPPPDGAEWIEAYRHWAR